MKKNQVEEINKVFQNFESTLSTVRLTVAESASVLRALDNLRNVLNQNLIVDKDETSPTN